MSSNSLSTLSQLVAYACSGRLAWGLQREAAVSRYEQAGLFIAESQGGLVATIFLSKPKVFGIVPAGTDPERC